MSSSVPSVGYGVRAYCSRLGRGSNCPSEQTMEDHILHVLRYD